MIRRLISSALVLSFAVASPCLAALLKCPDCDSAVSSRANACPKCGCPVSAMQVPSHSPPVRPALPSASFARARTALVLVNTKNGSGSGFLVDIDGTTYVLTNAHVLDDCSEIGLTTLSGKDLQWTGIQFANKKDLARLQLKIPQSGLRPLRISSSTVKMGEPVAVYGNSQGSEVATEIRGRVLGVGPDKIEIDAEFVRGNSGSPILDSKGEVIGVATYVTRTPPGADWVADNTRFTQTRRFGVRLLGVQWVTVRVPDLAQQLAILSDVDSLLVDLLTLLSNWMPDGGSTGPARDLMHTYSAAEMEKLYGRDEWPHAIEDFCEAYIALAINDRSRHSRVSKRSFKYRRLADQRDGTLGNLTRQAERSLSQTRWRTNYLKQKAELYGEWLDLTRKWAQQAKDGKRWGSYITPYHSGLQRREPDSLLK